MNFTMLNDNTCKKVHFKSLEILEKIGIEVPHPEMFNLLGDCGNNVDKKTNRVRMRPDFVEGCVSKAGKSFTLYGRDLTKRASFGIGKRNYNTTAGEAHWVEEKSRARRFANLGDVGTAVRFADALECITIPGAMADPHEINVSWRCVAVLAEMLKNTTKPVTFWFHDRKSAKYINELIIALRGNAEEAKNYPICYPLFEPISPLRFPYNGIDLLFETSKLDLPVPIAPMAQMGVSAPATIPALLAQQNAEVLAGVCITQLIKPGLPVCYGGTCHAFDMATTQLIFSGPEQALFGMAMTQMGKYYGFPVYVNTGLTDSKVPDGQAGIESGITLMLSAGTGADVFGHFGICGVDQGASLDILLMQHEIISYVESVLRDVSFLDSEFALDEIEKTGIGGSFLGTEHTANNFRKSQWFPKLLDRNFYQTWKEKGYTDMFERIEIEKKRILENHKAEPLPDTLAKQFDEIISAAKKDLS